MRYVRTPLSEDRHSDDTDLGNSQLKITVSFVSHNPSARAHIIKPSPITSTILVRPIFIIMRSSDLQVRRKTPED
ncbi:hypothetical protein PSAC2689_70012 [Paraburkholderia sacchari]